MDHYGTGAAVMLVANHLQTTSRDGAARTIPNSWQNRANGCLRYGTVFGTTWNIVRAKHQRTLESLFKRPTPTGIRWTDIVAMLKAADVEVAQRSGSRVLLKKGVERMVVHRLHPEPETGRATVRDIAVFLDAVGVKP